MPDQIDGLFDPSELIRKPFCVGVLRRRESGRTVGAETGQR
jgi:hypothetical protein